MASQDYGDIANDPTFAKKKIGVLSPMLVQDNTPYEFYRVAPKGVMLVIYPMGIKAFTREDVDRVFAPLDEQLEHLMLRGVHVVEQAGVPLQLLAGVDGHDRRIERIRQRTGLPATSSLLGAVAAAKHLGIRNIALVNKFTDAMNETMKEFFRREGIAVAGVSSWDETRQEMVARRFKEISAVEHAVIGYDLGSKAFRQFPDADGLYMPGGAWQLDNIVMRLEKEFDRPVISHRDAMAWDTLHHVGSWRPIPSGGRLLRSD